MTDVRRAIRVVVAGGGTAGWIAAAALSKQLGPLITVTLIESDEIGTVGVGEATIPTARTFHGMLGLDERAFMRATGATFKLGILFEGWGALGEQYFHSFGQIGRATWMGGFQHMWLQARAEHAAGDIADYCFELQAAKAGRFATSETAKISYAYHLDAGRYAAFLRQFSEANAVQRIEGKIGTVRQNAESGLIEALVLEDGRTIEGDLFIDCTGFRGLLIEQTLKAGYEDWSHWLPANSALAVQTRATGPARPFTRAIAQQAGWRWQIPLQHRVGNGHVYCSDHTTDEEARETLLHAIEGDLLSEPRLIRFATGRRRTVWVKNCVALGLSSGFVEPLESTSIHLIMIGITRLIQNFPFNGSNANLAKRYNDLAQNELERVRDFIVLHYHLTRRSDTPFWNHCRTMPIPDTLAERIELFRSDAHAFQTADDLFRADSWTQVMLGQGLEPQGHHHMGQLLGDGMLRQALIDLKRNIDDGVAQLPRHQDFLDRYCAA